MKVLYKLIVAFSIILLPSILLAAGANEKVKRIVKSYAISKSTYVEIENKYGDIDVEVWDKDSIKLEIVITVHSDKEEELDEMLKLINIDLSANSSFIVAHTDWSSDVNIFKKGLLKINQEVSNKGRYSVNYKIKMPRDIDLTLTNKFGNIFMTNYVGKLSIDISYGDLRAHSLTNLKQLNAKYGKVKINSLQNGRIDLNSVKPFSVDKALDLEIESSSSEISIESIGQLNLKSSHDEINIDKIGELNGTFSMSDLMIMNLEKAIHSVSKYGSVKLKYILPTVNVVYLEGNKSDLQVSVSKDFKAKVDIKMSNKEDFSYNPSFILESSDIDSEGLWRGKGYINQKGSAEIIIKSTSGYFQLDSK